MHVIDISNVREVRLLLDCMQAILDSGSVVHSIRVGIDPLDSGLKFSVNYKTWSPPIRGEQTG